MILVDAQQLSASRPNRPLFSGLSLTVSSGDRIGVVGLNGAGKTTLLRILAGRTPPESGEVRWGRGTRIGFLEQQPELPAGTVAGAVGGGWRGEAVLDRLGMTPLLGADTRELSGGQAKRTALARVLLDDHDLLILDEPTNHLDLDAIAFLEDSLTAFRGGLLLVTHDRHVLDRLTTKVLELDRGTGYLHVPQGVNAGSGYAAYLAGRAQREEAAVAAEDRRRNLATRELAWLRRGAPARTRKPKARIDAATEVVERRALAPARAGELGVGLGSARLGSKGVEVSGVGFRWPGSGVEVLTGVDLQLEPGDRIGVVGPNGIGKSTLLDLIAGRLTPTVGTVERGSTVRIGYYDQLGRALDDTQRVREAVAGPEKAVPTLEDARLMERFWFDGDAQFARIGLLSGGERRRLQLLLTLVEQPNVLLLDEPTNDLDLDTLRAIEDFLEDWPGIVVAASHDRVFLDRVVERVVAIDGGKVREVRGGVAGWLATRVTNTARLTTPAMAGPTTDSAPARASAAPRPAPRSPSTLRRLIGQAERELAQAVARHDQLAVALAATNDHARLASLSVDLADAQVKVDVAEERWLALAAEAEAIGLSV